MDTFFIGQNATGKDLVKQLLEPDGAPIDLTNATGVDLRMADKKRQTKVDAACAITDALNGWVSYLWQVGDTDTSGEFLGKFYVTWSGGQAETVPSNGSTQIVIDPEFPALP